MNESHETTAASSTEEESLDPREAAVLLSETKKKATVGLELNRSRASKSLLHFGGRRSALRPLRRHPQGNPLDDRSLEKSRRWTHGPFAERHPVGIAKVTNHLMGRHFPPKPAVGRSDRGYASNNCLPIGGRIKRSH